MSSLRSRLTYANVMATVAVFVALGGSSYAAIKVTGKNVADSSLTGRDLKNESVTGRDVTGLTTKDIANGSLLSDDFAAGQLPAGATGPPGPKGDAGAQGAQGERGPSFGDTGFRVSENLSACNTTTVITKSLTVPEPSRLFAHAQGNYTPNGTGASQVTLSLKLKSGSTVVADLPSAQHTATGAADISGVLSRAPTRSAGHDVPAGTYDLVLEASIAGASCPDGLLRASMSSNTLSYILLGA